MFQYFKNSKYIPLTRNPKLKIQFKMDFTDICTREHLVKSKLLLTSPMVSDPVVGPVIGANFLAYISFSHLTFTLLFFCCNSLVVEMLIESFPQSCKSTLFVLRLLSRILTLGSDACRFMCCSACTGCLVYMLTTSTGCSISINSQISRINLYLYIIIYLKK